jgi:hypothetical protein
VAVVRSHELATGQHYTGRAMPLARRVHHAGLARSPDMFFIFVFSPNFLIKKLFNITKFKVRKHDFTLNIDLKLFYTILVGQVVLG